MKNNVVMIMDRIRFVIDSRMSQYQPPKGTTEERILSIFRASSKVKIFDDEASIRMAIRWAIESKQPVKISLFWAVGSHARSTYKIKDWPLNIPRLGDIWGVYWFNFLDRKVKSVYSPGIEVVIVDEVSISRLIGWDDKTMSIRKGILTSLLPSETHISIVDMPNFSLDGYSSSAHNEQVLTVLTSTDLVSGEETLNEISSDLYHKADKDWEYIKRKVGVDVWSKGEIIAEKMNLISLARKETDWVKRSLFQGQSYIDGCILKKGRWSPDIWSMAFPQHGGALLESGNGSRFSVKILPEHRLELEGRIPQKALLADFGLNIPGEFTLYWE